jgi:single-strand DNA-binding protein
MASVNKVILIGNVGKDPEIRHLDNGTRIAKFSLATHETSKNREGEKVEQTEWHNIVILRDGLAEIAEKYLQKGKQIFVEGRIRTRNWEDKEGFKKSVTEIIADNFIMLGKRRTDSPGESSPEAENGGTIIEHPIDNPAIPEEPADDLSFK